MESSSQATFCKGLLEQAAWALDHGNPQQSEVLAGQAQVHAVGLQDLHLRAQADLVLARLDTMSSRFDAAYRRSRFAAEQFQKHGDIVRLPLALDVRSYSAACMGHTEQALSWAHETFTLREAAEDAQAAFTGLTYIGVINAFDGQYAEADETFTSARWFALESPTPEVHLHALLNQGLSLMMGLVAAGQQRPPPSELARLQQLLSQAHRAGTKGASVQIPLQAGNACMTQVLLQFLTASTLVLSNHCEEATLHLVNCKMWLQAVPRTSWLHSLAWWAQALWARQKGDLARAVLCAGEMEIAARVGQNVPMQRLASLFRTQLRQLEHGTP